MNNTVFIVDGLQGSGKRTFVQMLKEKLVHVVSVSYEDALRAVAEKMGWRNIPNDKENYAFLGKIHTLWTGFNDKLTDQILERLDADYSKHIVLIIIPKTKSDMEELVRRLEGKCELMSVLVYNKRANTSVSLRDSLVDFDYDILINNNKTLADFKKEVNMFIARYVKSFIRVGDSPIQRSAQSKRITKKNKKLKD